MAYTTINKSTDYFNTLTYTGTGSSSTKSGVGFQPDLTWVKARGNTTWHYLYDAVRTAGLNKEIHSNSSQAQGLSDGATYGYLSAFTSDGFSTVMGSNTGSDGFNKSGTNFVAWNWKANGAGSANTDGTITSTVSANQTAGFSIVKYTGNNTGGATVGHGLGAVPKMIIFRNYSVTEDWTVYHHKLSSNNYKVDLNNNSAQANVTNPYMENTTPTSTLITLGDHQRVNGSGNSIIAYCFAEKNGYSKFGSYIGNGNADGTFVYTGFKPAFVLKKNITDAREWNMEDNKRNGYNPNNYGLFPHNNDAEQTGYERIDLLSNGFKLRTNSDHWNESGDTFIYMAFGQSLVGSNNVPCTAR